MDEVGKVTDKNDLKKFGKLTLLFLLWARLTRIIQKCLSNELLSLLNSLRLIAHHTLSLITHVQRPPLVPKINGCC